MAQDKKDKCECKKKVKLQISDQLGRYMLKYPNCRQNLHVCGDILT